MKTPSTTNGEPNSSRVGLVGLGLMGAVIAERLCERGWQVIGYDIDPAHAQRMTAEISLACDVGDVFGRAETVILSLPDHHAVTAVLSQIGEEPVDEASACRLVIDTTTGDPEATQANADQLEKAGISMLDATISGSSQQLASDEAVVMIGGDHRVIEAQSHLLDALGQHRVHLGPVGSGSRAKLASNLVLGLHRLVLAEGLVFAEALGLDPQQFLELLVQTPAYSRQMDHKGPRMVAGDFESPAARLRQHAKDVDLILDCARSAGIRLPLTPVHARLLADAIAAGDGDLDNSAIIRQLRPPTSDRDQPNK
ncbi:MAG: 6-phosphogluconate dehydrogenase [Gemmatimonadetes bacterium]|jgi:3-hydroxyisobutyrate dehydrogenase-like beta-hydroxyacid dehydrogenase|nr:6-phosphogluconate dehydrogenase [Gemmatimonadota bacterium]MDP7365409.1 NAD(P)-dependent oxidoreductase [Candidatus Latescibacterota bacterium]